MFRRSSLVSLMFMSGIVVRLFVQWAGMRKLATDTSSLSSASSWYTTSISTAAPTSAMMMSNTTSVHANSVAMNLDLPLSLLLSSRKFTVNKAKEATSTTRRTMQQQVPVAEPAVSLQQSARTSTANQTHYSKSDLIRPSKSFPVVRIKKALNMSNNHRRAAAAYAFALARARARVEKPTNRHTPSLAANLGDLYERETGQALPSKQAVTGRRSFKLLNSIRIPKAASSALSVTARALAGCMPDGYPCCLDDVFGIDTCPIANLYCPYVRGCVGHLPDYEFADLPLPPRMESTITVLRNPVARGLSAFFYKQPHRPNNQCYTWQCFVDEYLSNPVYNNPMTKMLVGNYAYDPEWFLQDGRSNDSDSSGNINRTEMPKYETIVQQAKDRLCRMEWFGIAEWPLASALLLYESHPFSKLLPNPVVFGLPPSINATANTGTSTSTISRRVENKVAAARDGNKNVDKLSSPAAAEAAALRKNNLQAYQEFKKGVFVEGNGTQLLQRENAADMEIYDFARHVFCQRLQETGLLVRQATAKQVEPSLSTASSQNHDDWPFFHGCASLNKNAKSAQFQCPPRRLL